MKVTLPTTLPAGTCGLQCNFTARTRRKCGVALGSATAQPLSSHGPGKGLIPSVSKVLLPMQVPLQLISALGQLQPITEALLPRPLRNPNIVDDQQRSWSRDRHSCCDVNQSSYLWIGMAMDHSRLAVAEQLHCNGQHSLGCRANRFRTANPVDFRVFCRRLICGRPVDGFFFASLTVYRT